jgi:transcriptional regulator with XRE-family HTH domain
VSAWKTNRLRLLRAEHRLSQQEVAHRLDISQAQFSKWERGYVEPDAAQRRKLARIFKVPVTALAPPLEKVG